MIDITDASARRRFYLSRSLRKHPIGAGSNLSALMALPRIPLPMNFAELFQNEPWCLIGGVATRAYMPERTTRDIDILVAHPATIDKILRDNTWTYDQELFFPNTTLALCGTSYHKDHIVLDVFSSEQTWVAEALRTPTYDQTGVRVAPLAYLVLMKIDSARGVDQGDLQRMLGRVNDSQLNDIVAIIEKYSHDPQAADDVRQYAQLGRWERQQPQRNHDLDIDRGPTW
ncbi:MAG: hypothetical protein ACYDHD_11405 [Vulcanimicrobiaceae bacterium]